MENKYQKVFKKIDQRISTQDNGRKKNGPTIGPKKHWTQENFHLYYKTKIGQWKIYDEGLFTYIGRWESDIGQQKTNIDQGKTDTRQKKTLDIEKQTLISEKLTLSN